MGSGSGDSVWAHTRRHCATGGPDGSGVAPDAARRRASHQVERSSSSSAATASRTRGAKLTAAFPLCGVQGLTEPHRQLPPAPARPALAARHRGEGAAVSDGDNRDADLAARTPAHPEPADPAVLRARALGEDHQAPAVGQDLTGRGRHGATPPVDGEGVEQQGPTRPPATRCRRSSRPPRPRRCDQPLVGQRQQDQRGVEVGGVVGHEDHRALDAGEDVESLHAGAHLGAEHRLHPGLLRHLAGHLRGPAPRPVGAGRPSTSLAGTHGSAERGTCSAPTPAPARERPCADPGRRP